MSEMSTDLLYKPIYNVNVVSFLTIFGVRARVEHGEGQCDVCGRCKFADIGCVVLIRVVTRLYCRVKVLCRGLHSCLEGEGLLSFSLRFALKSDPSVSDNSLYT